MPAPNGLMPPGQDDADGRPSRPLVYVVDWLPPDFGAVGQYALNAARDLATAGRDVVLIGLTRGPPSTQVSIPPDGGGGSLTVIRLHASPYGKTRLWHRLAWTFATNSRLFWAAARHPKSFRADIQFTGAPPFFLYFALPLKIWRRARLIYRITDFYPEAIIAHLGRRSVVLGALERITWFLRRRVDAFEALGEDQRRTLERGGINPEHIVVKRDTAPITVTGAELPAPRPLVLGNKKVLLYSGNYGAAHEVDTVVDGFVRHYRDGNGRFGLWLNAIGQNADLLERRLRANGIAVARSAPVPLAELPSVLAAADAHLITLRTAFSGIVFPSKVYACIQSGKPIVFVGPTSSDVHLLCAQAGGCYRQVTPGDPDEFARALDDLAAAS
jgi:glycosyltransferase involved in cell wall biosynthesis